MTCTDGVIGTRKVVVGVLGRARVGRPAIGDEAGARLHMVSEERSQRLRARVGQEGHTDASETLGVQTFHGAAHENLLTRLPSAAQAGFLTADEEFVHLDLAGEAFPAGAHQGRAQPVQHRPLPRAHDYAEIATGTGRDIGWSSGPVGIILAG